MDGWIQIQQKSTIYNGNGPQFTSYEYKKLSQEWDFKHITSGPRYPKLDLMNGH